MTSRNIHQEVYQSPLASTPAMPSSCSSGENHHGMNSYSTLKYEFMFFLPSPPFPTHSFLPLLSPLFSSSYLLYFFFSLISINRLVDLLLSPEPFKWFTLSGLLSDHRVRSGLGSVSYWGGVLPQGSLACFKDVVSAVAVVKEARAHVHLESETV